MSGLTPAASALLHRYARQAVGEVVESTMKHAGAAHPLLEQLASVLLGEILTESTMNRLVILFERMIVELFGDDYPTLIEADQAIIDDRRED